MLQRDFKIARHLMNFICIIVYIKSVWHFTICVHLQRIYDDDDATRCSKLHSTNIWHFVKRQTFTFVRLQQCSC